MQLEDDDINGLLEDFTEAVYFFPCFGSGADVYGVWAEGIEISADFGAPYDTINLDAGDVASADYTIRVKTADLPALMPKDRFRIRGEICEATNIEPDNVGLTIVRLMRV